MSRDEKPNKCSICSNVIWLWGILNIKKTPNCDPNVTKDWKTYTHIKKKTKMINFSMMSAAPEI